MAARPIWNGILSFGLLNVPVALMSGERRIDLSFRMLDARDNTPIRYERVNAETGEEVPWKDIVKAFEYDKGSYVVLETEDIKSAAAERHESIDIDTFVDINDISPQFFEKPYVLVPGKKAEKGYVLLRETLKRTGRVGVAKVVIRTREYLCAVMPKGDALLLIILRYPQEVVDVGDYVLPAGKAEAYRVTDKELQMAEQLIESMSGTWNPGEYKDEFRDRLSKVIDERLRSKGKVSKKDLVDADTPEDAATNVVDFMALLQKSLATNKRTPASSETPTTKDAPAKKKAASKKAPAEKKPAEKK